MYMLLAFGCQSEAKGRPAASQASGNIAQVVLADLRKSASSRAPPTADAVFDVSFVKRPTMIYQNVHYYNVFVV